MGLEIRQLVVKSTVTSEPQHASDEQARVADLRLLREELLQESRRLALHARDVSKER
jgi:hypothetical protein